MPIVLINREDVVGVETPPVELPQSQQASDPAVAVAERMDLLEPIVENR